MLVLTLLRVLLYVCSHTTTAIYVFSYDYCRRANRSPIVFFVMHKKKRLLLLPSAVPGGLASSNDRFSSSLLIELDYNVVVPS